MISLASGKVLGVEQRNNNVGANICQSAYIGSNYQKWWFIEENGGYVLMSVGSGKVISIENTAVQNGVLLQQAWFNGDGIQSFSFRLNNDYTIENGVYTLCSQIDESKVIDIDGGSKLDGARAQLYQFNGSEAQRIQINRNDDGTYSLLVKHSGKAIEVSGGGYADNTKVQQYSVNGSMSQKWLIHSLGDGKYVFFSAVSGKALCLKDEVAENGVGMCVSKYTGEDKFYFVVKNNMNIIMSPTLSPEEFLEISTCVVSEYSGDEIEIQMKILPNRNIDNLGKDIYIVIVNALLGCHDLALSC